jgi:hypothetical protein
MLQRHPHSALLALFAAGPMLFAGCAGHGARAATTLRDTVRGAAPAVLQAPQERECVERRLIELGFAPADVSATLDALSDAELHAVAVQMGTPTANDAPENRRKLDMPWNVLLFALALEAFLLLLLLAAL